MNLFKYRKINKAELMEIQELHRLVITAKFKAIQIKNNTAFIPDGKNLAKQTEALANLYEKIKNEMVARKLLELGYPQNTKTTIDLHSGKIKIIT